jgi:hypothetical protein
VTWSRSKIAEAAGFLLIVAGLGQLVPQRSAVDWTNASTSTNSNATVREESHPNLLGWGTLLLGFLTLGSSHYFKLRDARRADRAEARDISRDQRSTDDLN